MRKRHFSYVLIVILIIILDQITKMVIRQNFSLHESIVVIPNFFNLIYLRNPGAAFGIFSQSDSSILKPLFFIISMVAVTLMVVIYYKAPEKDRLTRSAMSLIFSGAVGNMIDRVYLGEVVDFLDFYLYSYHWPAFNLADTSISTGVGLFIISFWQKR